MYGWLGTHYPDNNANYARLELLVYMQGLLASCHGYRVIYREPPVLLDRSPPYQPWGVIGDIGQKFKENTYFKYLMHFLKFILD